MNSTHNYEVAAKYDTYMMALRTFDNAYGKFQQTPLNRDIEMEVMAASHWVTVARTAWEAAKAEVK